MFYCESEGIVFGQVFRITVNYQYNISVYVVNCGYHTSCIVIEDLCHFFGKFIS